MKNIMTSIKKYAARITAGIIAAAALAATPLAAAVPVHAQEVQYVVYDYDYSSDHVTIDGFTAYEPGEYILNDSGKTMYLMFTDENVDGYVLVSVPAGDDYQLLYQESADGVTVSAYQFWVAVDYDASTNMVCFVPDTAF